MMLCCDWFTFSTALIGIHIRLHPDNINRDGGIEIPDAWMPTARIVMRQSELLKKQPITAEHHALEDHA